MCGCTANLGKGIIDVLVMPGSIQHRFSRNGLVPGAGSSEAAVGNLKMIAVTVESVAEPGGASVLDCSSARNHGLKLGVCSHSRLSGAHDGIIHCHLVLVVLGEVGMVGRGSISPGLMEKESGFFANLSLHIGDKVAQIRLISLRLSGQSADLLKTHVIPLLIFETGGKTGSGFGFFAVHYLTVIIVCSI